MVSDSGATEKDVGVVERNQGSGPTESGPVGEAL